jgi:hypothetical protein
MIVVLILVVVVVAVGRLGRCGNLQLRSWWRSAGVEHRRSSGRPSGVHVDLLQKEVITNFKKVWE